MGRTILKPLLALLLGLAHLGPALAQQAVSPEGPQQVNPKLDQFYRDHPDLRPPVRLPSTRPSVAPKAIGKSCTQPAYPREARRLGLKGSVQLKFMIDAEGSVNAAEVEKTSGHALLDEAGLAAIRQCKFEPAIKDGRAIESWHSVSYSWSL